MTRFAVVLVLAGSACGHSGNATDGSTTSRDGGLHDGSGGADFSTASDGATVGNVDLGPIVDPQPLSINIVVDQFGYRTSAEKIAVIRNPKTGFDSSKTFAPGTKYALVDAHSSAKLLEAAPVAWNKGATDTSSGDQAWWFDFSTVTTRGDYFVLDEDKTLRSDVFRISDDVYHDVMMQAVRMYFYQRDNQNKDAAHAGASWADTAAHMGAGQDPTCKLYQGSTSKDTTGGWWDAGDQNKYTNWGNEYIVELLHAYVENPSVFTDDYNIPESGNGVPDLLDEVRYEVEWVVHMTNSDGSVNAIVGQAGAALPNTLPSTATGACTYGPPNTSAALSTAASLAFASIVYKPIDATFAADLSTRAQKAWTWALANPNVVWMNGGTGVGAGEQETDDAGRAAYKLQAAELLFELTGSTTYQTFFDQNYKSLQLIASGTVDLFDTQNLETLLAYTKAKGATGSVVSDILSKYKGGLASSNNLGSVTGDSDPYLAFMYTYVWGSNQNKAQQGLVFTDAVDYTVDGTTKADSLRGAERYVHYFHGVNPLSLVYLSNMASWGATNYVVKFYHSWYHKGSDWDTDGVSKYGPPPGYLVGGPNPSYNWDTCCPSGCSGNSCGSAVLSPPAGQPNQKAYTQFNDDWPLDSWQVTEPDDGYQARYIHLLSHFM